jgi:hypothetical protein
MGLESVTLPSIVPVVLHHQVSERVEGKPDGKIGEERQEDIIGDKASDPIASDFCDLVFIH